MSVSAALLGPLCVPELYNYRLRPTGDLRQWIRTGTYQVYDPIAQDAFSLTATQSEPLIAAMAYDFNRLSMAGAESITAGAWCPHPHSVAWALVRAYYAAFYAANALLRLRGVNISQIPQTEATRLYDIATLFGNAPIAGLQSGYYECVYVDEAVRLDGRILAGAKGGLHEKFWAIFIVHWRSLSDAVLNSYTSTADRDVIIEKMKALEENLTCRGANGGNWLSQVRNAVNYRHEYDTWFPARLSQNAGVFYESLAGSWRKDPLDTPLDVFEQDDIGRVVASAAFLIGLCRELAVDIVARGRGRAFPSYGIIRYYDENI